MKLKFVGVKPREGDVKEFTFKTDSRFSWEAGQYMHYILPHENEDERGNERWFTNSAAPSEGEVRITTRINNEHSSSFKQALLKLTPGEEVEADGPEGDFVMNDYNKNYLFIVGGIGITPVRSILTEAAAKGWQPNVTLLYANRSSDIVFQNELENLQSNNPNLVINYVIEPNRLDESLLKKTLSEIEAPEIYVSGPEPMVAAMITQLQTLGVNKDNLHSDDFPGYEKI